MFNVEPVSSDLLPEGSLSEAEGLASAPFIEAIVLPRRAICQFLWRPNSLYD